MRTLTSITLAVALTFSIACGLGESEVVVTEPVASPDPVPTSADPDAVPTTPDADATATCCCAYIQQASMTKTYDQMVARNCTEWGFECVDEGFCEGTTAAETVAPAPVVPAPAPAPAPVTRPAPAPAPATRPTSTQMTRPGSTTRPTSTTRPSSGSGGMSRPTRPRSTGTSSGSSTGSSGGMTRPR